MGWLNSRAPYNSILRYIKERGVRVFHREIKSGAGGLFDCEKVIITIDKDSRETWEGCYLLAHEQCHYLDWREGKFKDFFSGNYKNDEAGLNLIIEAEMSAVNGAVEMLKMWGIDHKPAELTKSGLEDSIRFWKKYYLGEK